MIVLGDSWEGREAGEGSAWGYGVQKAEVVQLSPMVISICQLVSDV